MDSNAFGVNHLPSQALVVLSEAASGLNEVLRGQRPFQPRVNNCVFIAILISFFFNFKT